MASSFCLAARRLAPLAQRGPIASSSFTRSSLLLCRNIFTSADTTQLTNKPDSATEPLTLKPSEDSFQSYNCDLQSFDVQVTKDELLQRYGNGALCETKMIWGFCQLAIGQEAVSVGMEHGIKPRDRVITGYRCHPFAVLRGGTIEGVLAELLGRQAGMSHGKGGSIHIFTPSFFGGNGIVGAQVPVNAGAAFAQMYRGEKTCTFAMYGDGASNQGQVFEACNMAKLWNLPCIFVCENNKYGMGTPAERSSSNTSYYMRGDKIPVLQFNGMDIIAAKQAVQYARNWAVDQGNGPLILEFVTYRYGGHSMSDPGTTYRTREEVQRMRSTQDPIRGLQKYLEEWGVASEQELKAIDKEAKTVVDAAVEKAKSSPEPAVKDLWSDIYYKGTEPEMMRGREKEEFHRY
ncbi:pyruvate dehydrogenase e1 component alpha subunit [Coprinopsis sp. MPI-PUGE-AT-0042]|nr:pyruvate dehydrogenase e1 component alpha subunit [Coprinopsis sp. MPI-PUGE-AT-0042]